MATDTNFCGFLVFLPQITFLICSFIKATVLCKENFTFTNLLQPFVNVSQTFMNSPRMFVMHFNNFRALDLRNVFAPVIVK